jgi:hypothetical protein
MRIADGFEDDLTTGAEGGADLEEVEDDLTAERDILTNEGWAGCWGSLI